jgi:hypothetical protein
MKHFRDVKSYGDNSRGKVHLAYNGTTLCRKLDEYMVDGDITIKRLYETALPATCLACYKALEMSIRQAINKLPPIKLEDVAAFLEEL